MITQIKLCLKHRLKMNKPLQEFIKSNVASVASAHFLHDVYSSFFAPLIPLLTEKLGFAYAVAGMLSVVQKLPSLLNPMIGLIADRMVIRSAIVLAPITTIFAMSLLGRASSVLVLGILLFTCGISAAIFHVTAPVLMRQVSGNQIGRGMSYFMFGGEISRTIGPLIITAAVSWWGFEGTWRLIPLGLGLLSSEPLEPSAPLLMSPYIYGKQCQANEKHNHIYPL